MYSEMIIQNYTAAADIKAGQFVANVASNDVTAPKCQPAGLTVEKIQVLGVSLKDSSAGDVVSFYPFITGKTLQVRAGAAISAGVPIGFDANGDAVEAAAGYAAAPMWSLNAAAAAGDMIDAVVVHTCGIV